MGNRKLRVTFNAPVILGFSAVCIVATLLDGLTNRASTNALFSVYRASLGNPLTWPRFLGHVFGHMGWAHLTGNLMYVLILGPMLEEKYGAKRMVLMIAVVAVVTGLVNFLFFPRNQLLGASGVVFAMILLSSMAGLEEGGIPLTFVLVAVLYIGQQVYQAFFAYGGETSHMAHIVGGLTGAALGFVMNKRQAGR